MISDYIKDSLKNIKRDKSNIILIIVFTLLFILLFTDTIFIKNFFGYINYAVNTNINFRTFTADKHDTNFTESAEELKKLKHVTEVYIAAYGNFSIESDLTLNDLDGFLELEYGTENTAPDSVMGKNIEDLNSGEMICPLEFYPDSLTSETKINKDYIWPADKTLNYEFMMYFPMNKVVDNDIVEGTGERKFKIVGLYNNRLVMNENNVCYITPQDMEYFHTNLNPHINYNEDDYAMVHVVADKASNLSKVKKEVENLGYYVSEDNSMTFDEKIVGTITLLGISFFIIIIGTILFLFNSFLKKNIKRRIRQLGILRSCGYTKKEILKKEIVRNALILFICFIISSIIFSILFSKIIVNFFEYTTYVGFYVKNSYVLLLLIFIIVLVILLNIDIRMIRKNIDKPIYELLKEE